MKDEKQVQNQANEQNNVQAQEPKDKNAAFKRAMELIEQTPEEERVVDEIERSDYIIIPGLAVSRECVVKSGKKYYNYFTKGKIRRRDMTAYFRPAVKAGRIDVRSYDLLDTVFDGAGSVPLAVRTYKRQDQITKKVTNGLLFYAYVYDEEFGKEYTAELRPDQGSDRQILLTFIDQINTSAKLGLVIDM